MANLGGKIPEIIFFGTFFDIYGHQLNFFSHDGRIERKILNLTPVRIAENRIRLGFTERFTPETERKLDRPQ